MISIVLGTCFGDEGKGQAVLSLSHKDALVIRFSGGHQCGHTAIDKDGRRHVFAQFGSGTFNGAATYISEHCTVFPTAFKNEYSALSALESNLPAYYVHPKAMITTPYDLAFNRALSMITGHGTCGVGFGTTLQRNEEFYNLYANDLLTDYVLNTKMEYIRQYYEGKVSKMNMSSLITYEQELERAMEQWDDDLQFYKEQIHVATIEELSEQYHDFIFEGSQGIMLDQHFGFFPQVTRSNTTSQNAMEIIRQSKQLSGMDITTYYISRCYLTRHGNGPFPSKTVELINTQGESNLENDWQGIFKTSTFDPALVSHAISCDSIYNSSSRKVLVLTCFDQLKNQSAFLQQLKTLHSGQIDEIQIKDKPDWSM